MLPKEADRNKHALKAIHAPGSCEGDDENLKNLYKKDKMIAFIKPHPDPGNNNKNENAKKKEPPRRLDINVLKAPNGRYSYVEKDTNVKSLPQKDKRRSSGSASGSSKVEVKNINIVRLPTEQAVKKMRSKAPVDNGSDEGEEEKDDRPKKGKRRRPNPASDPNKVQDGDENEDDSAQEGTMKTVRKKAPVDNGSDVGEEDKDDRPKKGKRRRPNPASDPNKVKDGDENEDGSAKEGTVKTVRKKAPVDNGSDVGEEEKDDRPKKGKRRKPPNSASGPNKGNDEGKNVDGLAEDGTDIRKIKNSDNDSDVGLNQDEKDKSRLKNGKRGKSTTKLSSADLGSDVSDNGVEQMRSRDNSEKEEHKTILNDGKDSEEGGKKNNVLTKGKGRKPVSPSALLDTSEEYGKEEDGDKTAANMKGKRVRKKPSPDNVKDTNLGEDKPKVNPLKPTERKKAPEKRPSDKSNDGVLNEKKTRKLKNDDPVKRPAGRLPDDDGKVEGDDGVRGKQLKSVRSSFDSLSSIASETAVEEPPNLGTVIEPPRSKQGIRVVNKGPTRSVSFLPDPDQEELRSRPKRSNAMKAKPAATSEGSDSQPLGQDAVRGRQSRYRDESDSYSGTGILRAASSNASSSSSSAAANKSSLPAQEKEEQMKDEESSMEEAREKPHSDKKRAAKPSKTKQADRQPPLEQSDGHEAPNDRTSVHKALASRVTGPHREYFQAKHDRRDRNPATAAAGAACSPGRCPNTYLSFAESLQFHIPPVSRGARPHLDERNTDMLQDPSAGLRTSLLYPDRLLLRGAAEWNKRYFVYQVSQDGAMACHKPLRNSYEIPTFGAAL